MKNIMIILLVLVIIMLGLSWFLSVNRDHSEALLRVVDVSGREKAYNEFSNVAHQRLAVGKGKEAEAFKLIDILSKKQLSGNWQSIIIHSEDGGQLTVERAELDNLYLAEMADGERSYLRLIIPSDTFHQRWLKYINMIELK